MRNRLYKSLSLHKSRDERKQKYFPVQSLVKVESSGMANRCGAAISTLDIIRVRSRAVAADALIGLRDRSVAFASSRPTAAIGARMKFLSSLFLSRSPPRARGSCIRRGRRSSFESGAAIVSCICRASSRERGSVELWRLASCAVDRYTRVYSALFSLFLSLSFFSLSFPRDEPHVKWEWKRRCTQPARQRHESSTTPASRASRGPRSATRLPFPSHSVLRARTLVLQSALFLVSLSLSFPPREQPSYPARAPPTQRACRAYLDLGTNECMCSTLDGVLSK